MGKARALVFWLLCSWSKKGRGNHGSGRELATGDEPWKGVTGNVPEPKLTPSVITVHVKGQGSHGYSRGRKGKGSGSLGEDCLFVYIENMRTEQEQHGK